jgi:hypothetical protein
MKVAVFWVVEPCSLIEAHQPFRSIFCLLISLMMKADNTTETLVNFHQAARRYDAYGSHLQISRRENWQPIYHSIQE